MSTTPLESRILALLTLDYRRTGDIITRLPDVPGWLTRQTLDRLHAAGQVQRRRGKRKAQTWRRTPPTHNGTYSTSPKQERTYGL